MTPAPRRQPVEVWRVRWTRSTWRLHRDGYVRWNYRWLTRWPAVRRFSHRLYQHGADVEVDHYELRHLSTDTWPPLEEL